MARLTHELRYRPEFQSDVAEASAWYELREPGLGARFELELRNTLLRVAERPESFPVIERNVRRARLHVFPYLVVFRTHSTFVEVAGVVHGARHPSVQRRRGRRR
jgi:plasmid stabilization system protein ParE